MPWHIAYVYIYGLHYLPVAVEIVVLLNNNVIAGCGCTEIYCAGRVGITTVKGCGTVFDSRGGRCTDETGAVGRKIDDIVSRENSDDTG
jgi:hypothetical protein